MVAICPEMHQTSGTLVLDNPLHFGRLFLGGLTWRPEVQTGVQLLEVLSNEDGVRFVRLSQRLGFIRGGLSWPTCGVIITPVDLPGRVVGSNLPFFDDGLLF